MRKLILFCLLYGSLTAMYAQDYFIYVNGEKRYYEISPNKVVAQFEAGTTNADIKSVVRKSTPLQLSGITETGYKDLKFISFTGTDKDSVMQFVNQWKDRTSVLYSGCVFVDKEGKETAALTNRINVRLKKESDYQVLLKSIISYDIGSIEQNEFDSTTYLLSINYSSTKNAMQIANELYEKGLFEYAEPDLLLFIKYATNDACYPQQWALNNTGQSGGTSGMDIKANQAWNITTGSPNIKIAILDSGGDLTHPDLVNNLLTGYDATGGNNNGNHSGHPHGTACAGIAAAQANNATGIAGVAYNCRILPVHMGGSPLSSHVANGLNWARTNGAKVVSMSFFTDETNAVNTALSQAASAGCVLVAASGNDNISTINYPARNPNVIAVGAINRNGQRANFSNYGTALDVVAPGVDIPTTDRQGNNGYNYVTTNTGLPAYSDYSNKDYTGKFGGTSAACPHVAGVAALILSVRPDLTQTQVRQAIESSSRKLSGYSFSNNSAHPNGTWNNQVGHGLVNAHAAVSSVLPVISGPSMLCSGASATLTVSNAPTGFTWTCSPNLTKTTSGHPTTATFVKDVSSSGSWVKIMLGSTELARKEMSSCASVTIPAQYGCDGTYHYGRIPLQSVGANGITQYGWQVSSGTIIEHPVGCLIPMDLVRIIGGSGSLYVRGYNSAGWTEWFYVGYLTSCSSGGGGGLGGLYSTTYPNPVSDVLNIEISAVADTLQTAQASKQQIPVSEVKLYNQSGTLVRSLLATDTHIQLNVADLPAGIYYLHVGKKGKTPEIKTIIVNR